MDLTKAFSPACRRGQCRDLTKHRTDAAWVSGAGLFGAIAVLGRLILAQVPFCHAGCLPQGHLGGVSVHVLHEAAQPRSLRRWLQHADAAHISGLCSAAAAAAGFRYFICHHVYPMPRQDPELARRARLGCEYLHSPHSGCGSSMSALVAMRRGGAR